MKIALDYDDTFTADRNLWTMFVKYIQDKTVHTITFVTFRTDMGRRQLLNADIEADAKELGIDIVYCRGYQKSEIFDADIWIDDRPELIPTLKE